jgi:hypothetical protein
MKQKIYVVNLPKEKNKPLKIKVDLSSIPNKMHLDAQIHHPAKVHEDKRFKKPKHKNKDMDW